ncbi:hypothetical protein ACIGO9_30045 [Nocardia asteroides]|uniref:hypothetical protein n=1 Tax=Nocardia asteroides TaxID=1824 RepID=UPI0037CB7144
MANRLELYVREVDGHRLPDGVLAYEDCLRSWTIVVDGIARLDIQRRGDSFCSYRIGDRFDIGRTGSTLGATILAELQRLTTRGVTLRGTVAMPEPGQIGRDDSVSVPMWKIGFQGPRTHQTHTFFAHTEHSVDAVKEWQPPFGPDDFVVTVTPMQVSANFLHDPDTYQVRMVNAISRVRDHDITAYTSAPDSALALAKDLHPFNNTRTSIDRITSVHFDGYRTEPLAQSPSRGEAPSVYELIAEATLAADTTTTPTPPTAPEADAPQPEPGPTAYL